MEFKAEDKASPSDTDKAVDGGGGMGPEEALRAFAESVGMSVDAMWEGVTRDDSGEIVEIDWSDKNLERGPNVTSEGTLLVVDMHMPSLRKLDLSLNDELKGEGMSLVDSVKVLLL